MDQNDMKRLRSALSDYADVDLAEVTETTTLQSLGINPSAPVFLDQLGETFDIDFEVGVFNDCVTVNDVAKALVSYRQKFEQALAETS